jgi:type II secretory pathway component GspD/PulD (secretin)
METEVKDLKNFSSSVRTLIRQLGGYVDAEEFTIDDYRKNATITLKVPVQKFEEAVNNLSEHSVAVHKVSISSQDVSAEIVDIKARLEVRSATRDRYIQLMKGAKNVEDLLRVQSEVNSIQEEIESGKSRANYLAHASAMSTINITCYQLLKPAPIVEEKSENRIMNAFLTGWSIMSSVLLGLLSIWPLLLLIILLYLIFRKK